MTVKVTKPAINLREELADLRKPSGIAGEALLRADSVQEQRDLIGAGRRNLLINGRGFVDQRGLSGVGLNSGNYGLDRWYAGAGGITFTQLTGGGFKAGRTASAAWTRVGQKIEDCYNTIGTKPFTVSFDIKWNVHSGNENSRVFFRWLQADGTETGTSVGANIDKVGVNGWEKFSATLSLPNDATNPKHLMMLIYGSRGTAAPWEFELDNVQLELGSVATEFEHRSYGEELALCQRYYEKWSGSKAMHPQYSSEASGVYAAARELWNDFKVEKRSNPMVTVGGSPTPTAVNASIYGFGAQVSVASSTASVRISEWTANAEL